MVVGCSFFLLFFLLVQGGLLHDAQEFILGYLTIAITVSLQQ